MTSYIKIQTSSTTSLYRRITNRFGKIEVNDFKLSERVTIPYISLETSLQESEKSKKLKIRRAARILKNLGVDKVVISDDTYSHYILDEGISVISDCAAYIKRHALKIISFALSRYAFIDTSSVCAVLDDDASNITFEMIDTISKHFREICIISNNKEKASEIVEEYFQNTGTPILTGNGTGLNRCSVLISFNVLNDISELEINRHALIIDLSGTSKKQEKLNRVATGFIPYSGGEQGIAPPEDLMKLFASERIDSFEIKSLIFS